MGLMWWLLRRRLLELLVLLLQLQRVGRLELGGMCRRGRGQVILAHLPAPFTSLSSDFCCGRRRDPSKPEVRKKTKNQLNVKVI